MSAQAPRFRPPEELRRRLQTLLGVGALTLLVGLLLSPDRVAANMLLVVFYLATLGLGGVFFVALSYAADATWAVALRRVPEALAGVLPVAALLTGRLAPLHAFAPFVDERRRGLHGAQGLVAESAVLPGEIRKL